MVDALRVYDGLGNRLRVPLSVRARWPHRRVVGTVRVLLIGHAPEVIDIAVSW